jgi:predicted NUDIX family NTP pyrophosphohydrolase
MAKRSAGILLYRFGANGPEVLLVHPGGPFWARKDLGAWSIPKGEIDPGENPQKTALREFREETGTTLPDGPFLDLGEVRQKGGKVVVAFGLEGDLDPALISSDLVEIEWPPRSGRKLSIPEIDRAAWFTLGEARERILASQAPFLDRVSDHLAPPA